MVIFISSCNKTVEEDIITNDKFVLKQILNNTQNNNSHKSCRWEYAHTEKEHIFLYSCIPKKNQSSFYSIEKRYRISKKYLKVDNTYMMFGKKILIRINEENNKITIGIPLNMIHIYW